MGLYDCIMLKENHILSTGSLEQLIKNAINQFPKTPIIVEVESLEDFNQRSL